MNHELSTDEWLVIWDAVYAVGDESQARAILLERREAVRQYIADTSDEPQADWQFVCGMLGVDPIPL